LAESRSQACYTVDSTREPLLVLRCNFWCLQGTQSWPRPTTLSAMDRSREDALRRRRERERERRAGLFFDGDCVIGNGQGNAWPRKQRKKGKHD
ncbi:hypothetical protein GBAR_LOCUS20484, partial [Geodia barretti]